MIKSIREFIRELSLTQQLITIVVLTLGFFLFFVFGTLSQTMNRFVDEQIYDLIDYKQRDVIYNYINGVPEALMYGIDDPKISHIIGTQDGQYITNGTERIENNLINQIKLQLDSGMQRGSVRYQYRDSRLYTITNIPNTNAAIATIISRDYNNAFKSMLLNNVINTILVIISIVFLILLIWVSTIIHPLNMIRVYIDKIRSGEDANLNVNRHDEIGQLADVLVEMNQEIRHQEHVKQEMIQNISHDLKTPIATIKSYSEAIKDGIYPYETLEKSVDVILEHADRLEKKVFNLLTLNRMDYLMADQLEANEEFELKETIEQVIVSSKQLSQDVNVALIGDDSLVYGSQEPWRVVIENLVDNALRYATHEVIIKTDNHFVSVYNDGSTINTNRVDQIFKAYEKGDGGQFGLGLSIVHKVLRNYGYRITASNFKEGVIFEIRKDL